MRCLIAFALALLGWTWMVGADGPQDNNPKTVRRVPMLGVEVPEAEAKKIQAKLQTLDEKIKKLQGRAATKPYLADVQIFHRAVDQALNHREFFKKNEIAWAHELLAEGMQRADRLAGGGTPPWATAKGLVVRGFVSRLDQTPQPYGLVVPDNYDPQGKSPHRLDLWFHGRGERQVELGFIRQRMKNKGPYTPVGAFVLHPFGRYSNAFKFAGEVDVWEALAHAKAHYRIDEDRLAVRGFSMGGAGAWQFAVHDPDRWFAANPGAGFSETPEFLKTFQGQTLKPTWWERKLWHLYNCTDHAVNLSGCPTIAYSGELDRQKQAADIMAAAMAQHGLKLNHVVGPKTGHKIHPESKKIIEAFLAEKQKRGRDHAPKQVRFTTYTLKYNRSHWIAVDRMTEHWAKAHVVGEWEKGGAIQLMTRGVEALTVSFDKTHTPFAPDSNIHLLIDGQRLDIGKPNLADRWRASAHRAGKTWKLGPHPEAEAGKRHNLQGPIDDAFMGPFVFVKPAGTSKSPQVQAWVRSELDRAIVHWRRHFRGDALVKDAADVSDQIIAERNLILWGDPASQPLIQKIADKLPIQWDEKQIVVGPDKTDRFDAKDHALILVTPNPLNPKRYVVLNSSFTFRDFAYLNNARQVPMLPDWAVVDLKTPPGNVWPGNIVRAGFFDENWKLKSR